MATVDIGRIKFYATLASVEMGRIKFFGTPITTNITADAGDDQPPVEPWSIVQLDGTGSTTDNLPLSYSWAQTAGPTAALSSSSAAQPTFEAPAVVGGTTVTFQLTITDAVGITDTDTVSIPVMYPTDLMHFGAGWVPVYTVELEA